MRYRITAYDRMAIPRVQGRRREVRRRLAGQSQVLLAAYRAGRDVDDSACPLQEASSWRTSSTAQVSA